ncbi:Protein of unknown function [Pyronema omphalodes CBS 100304]|uniref:Uncharacterized protein n=1 Tax=Pyronema omphalodes (strain CBS 100304) TaxID=1076935 RepID=U4L6S1_PYROM|nr:Protein of unknown function [Pyronema omphalodes CBS 100304]
MADINPDDAWAGLIDPALVAWDSVYAPVTSTPSVNSDTQTATTTTTKATRSSKKNPGKRLKPQPQDHKDVANNDEQDKSLTKQYDNFEKWISEIKKEMTQMKQSMKQQQAENARLLKKNDELEKGIAENKKEMQKIKAKVVELDQIVLPTTFNLSGFFSRTTRMKITPDQGVIEVARTFSGPYIYVKREVIQDFKHFEFMIMHEWGLDLSPAKNFVIDKHGSKTLDEWQIFAPRIRVIVLYLKQRQMGDSSVNWGVSCCLL